MTTTDNRAASDPAAIRSGDRHPAGAGTDGDGPPRRRRGGWLAVLAVLVLAAGGVWVVTRNGQGGGPVAEAAVATGLADVTRGDLTEVAELDGTLEYAEPVTVAGKRMGTLTVLTAEGEVVERGGRLFEVDGEPVRLLYGTRPAWRDLKVGDEGPDVRQLEENLDKLGYADDHDVTVDDEFTAFTREAVEDWQADKGMTSDGVVNLGEVVFLPGAVRVGEHLAAGGALAQADVMKVTTTERVVTIDLATSDQDDVEVGDAVTVQLPDGGETGGEVTEVGRVAESAASDQDPAAQAEETDPTIQVTVVLDDPDEAGSLDQAPVGVEIVTDTAEGVLTVPVNALLALAEGGYAVEVDEGGQRRLVAVDTGMFADGRVEVSGEGLAEGTKVVVPV